VIGAPLAHLTPWSQRVRRKFAVGSLHPEHPIGGSFFLALWDGRHVVRRPCEELEENCQPRDGVVRGTAVLKESALTHG
jgi:hypothetical protein